MTKMMMLMMLMKPNLHAFTLPSSPFDCCFLFCGALQHSALFSIHNRCKQQWHWQQQQSPPSMPTLSTTMTLTTTTKTPTTMTTKEDCRVLLCDTLQDSALFSIHHWWQWQQHWQLQWSPPSMPTLSSPLHLFVVFCYAAHCRILPVTTMLATRQWSPTSMAMTNPPLQSILLSISCGEVYHILSQVDQKGTITTFRCDGFLKALL